MAVQPRRFPNDHGSGHNSRRARQHRLGRPASERPQRSASSKSTSTPRPTTRATSPARIGWNWTTQLCDTLVRDIIPPAKFEELMAQSGIGNDTTVILYGDNNNWFAAWAFWQLKVYGHKDVRIMNGGRKKWLAEGRELGNQTSDARRGHATSAAAADLSLRAFLPEVQAAVEGRPRGAGRRALPGEFTGEILAPPGLPETCQRGGHIPGRQSIPWGKACNDDGTFKSRRRAAAALRRRGRHARRADHRLLPHRRALQPHLVRAQVPARLPQRQELRRLLDRVGQPGRRARREAVRSRRLHPAPATAVGLVHRRRDVPRGRHVLLHGVERRSRRSFRKGPGPLA